MYGKKKMMGGGKMPKPMMKKGGKMSALVIMAKPTKKAAVGADMDPEKPKLGMKKSSKPKEKKSYLQRSVTSVKRKLMEPVNTTKSELAPMGTEKLTPTRPRTMVAVKKGNKTEIRTLRPTMKVKKISKTIRKKISEGVGAGSGEMPSKEMKKGGKMIKSKAPVTFAPKSAKNVKGPSPKMAKGGKMKSC